MAKRGPVLLSVVLLSGSMLIFANELPESTPPAAGAAPATSRAIVPAPATQTGDGPLRSTNYRSFQPPAAEGALATEITPDPYARKHTPALSFDIDDTAMAEVQKLVVEFSHPSRLPSFLTSYSRNYLFRTKIFEELSARGLPPEIFYIAFIESEFRVDARSATGALGLWQFMENSMAPWMSRNAFKDERLSFYAATEAAVAKLEENYRALGDWLLAFAAYNAGLGAVRRAVAATGEHDFWKLAQRRAIPDQSIRYVTKVLAAAWLGQQLGRLGAVQPWYDTSRWVRILVPGDLPLSAFAQWTGLPLSFLELANAHLLQQRTPPNERFYPMTLPQRYVQLLRARPPMLAYAVRQGDTLWSIAQRFGTTVGAISAANELEGGAIRQNQTLNIPLVFSDY